MGLYIYLNDFDLKDMRKPSDTDSDFRDLFLEALSYDKTLMIKEIHRQYRDRNWFGFPTGIGRVETLYSIYHECTNDVGKTLYEARQMICASGDKKVAEAYLYGIINGNLHNKLEINKTPLNKN